MRPLEIKQTVLQKVASGGTFIPLPKAKWRIGDSVVHVRYRSYPKSDGQSFAFNINPNTLSAEFELWICRDCEIYYFSPIVIMKKIYSDRDTYVDKTHPNIRIAEVNIRSHRILYGRGGKALDGSEFFQAVLSDFK